MFITLVSNCFWKSMEIWFKKLSQREFSLNWMFFKNVSREVRVVFSLNDFLSLFFLVEGEQNSYAQNHLFNQSDCLFLFLTRSSLGSKKNWVGNILTPFFDASKNVEFKISWSLRSEAKGLINITVLFYMKLKLKVQTHY